ncbi:DapH/DapD/GlmU-related protein [Granulimonas faecalis]|uniref:DapH/DapD/GlmU-related protein n=1 Tax=Granulimonas faecalis TaxID=2894155 RepID=UPI0035128FFD
MNISQYSMGERLTHMIYVIYGKLRYPGSRLIRLPFYVRGRKGLELGPGLTVGRGCRFDIDGPRGTLKIGADCNFNDRVHIVAHASVTIGDRVLMASNIFISDTSHGALDGANDSPLIPPVSRSLRTKPVSIGDDVWIGEGACIMPGVHLGNGCIVGANAVVTHDAEPNTTLAGVPAVPLKRWDGTEWVRL